MLWYCITQVVVCFSLCESCWISELVIYLFTTNDADWWWKAPTWRIKEQVKPERFIERVEAICLSSFYIKTTPFTFIYISFVQFSKNCKIFFNTILSWRQSFQSAFSPSNAFWGLLSCKSLAGKLWNFLCKLFINLPELARHNIEFRSTFYITWRSYGSLTKWKYFPVELVNSLNLVCCEIEGFARNWRNS